MDESDDIDKRIQDILAEAGIPDGSTFMFGGRVIIDGVDLSAYVHSFEVNVEPFDYDAEVSPANYARRDPISGDEVARILDEIDGLPEITAPPS